MMCESDDFDQETLEKPEAWPWKLGDLTPHGILVAEGDSFAVADTGKLEVVDWLRPYLEKHHDFVTRIGKRGAYIISDWPDEFLSEIGVHCDYVIMDRDGKTDAIFCGFINEDSKTKTLAAAADFLDSLELEVFYHTDISILRNLASDGLIPAPGRLRWLPVAKTDWKEIKCWASENDRKTVVHLRSVGRGIYEFRSENGQKCQGNLACVLNACGRGYDSKAVLHMVMEAGDRKSLSNFPGFDMPIDFRDPIWRKVCEIRHFIDNNTYHLAHGVCPKTLRILCEKRRRFFEPEERTDIETLQNAYKDEYDNCHFKGKTYWINENHMFATESLGEGESERLAALELAKLPEEIRVSLKLRFIIDGHEKASLGMSLIEANRLLRDRFKADFRFRF